MIRTVDLSCGYAKDGSAISMACGQTDKVGYTVFHNGEQMTIIARSAEEAMARSFPVELVLSGESSSGDQGFPSSPPPPEVPGFPVPYGPEQGISDTFQDHRFRQVDKRFNHTLVSLHVVNQPEFGFNAFEFHRKESGATPVYRCEGGFYWGNDKFIGSYQLFYGDTLIAREKVDCDVHLTGTLIKLDCIGGLSGASNKPEYTVTRTSDQITMERVDAIYSRVDHGALRIVLQKMDRRIN